SCGRLWSSSFRNNSSTAPCCRPFSSRKKTWSSRLGRMGWLPTPQSMFGSQPIVAVNPEPARFDGVLLPFLPDQARDVAAHVLEGKASVREVTLAEAKLNDGQRLLAFNDLFIGAHSHASALYRIACGKRGETQSSSGVLVSTGAGSTGWVSSVFN